MYRITPKGLEFLSRLRRKELPSLQNFIYALLEFLSDEDSYTFGDIALLLNSQKGVAVPVESVREVVSALLESEWISEDS